MHEGNVLVKIYSRGIIMQIEKRIPILLASCLIALAASAQDNKAPGAIPQAVPGTLPAGIVSRQGTVVSPLSDKAPAGYAHTNYKIFIPAGHPGPFVEPDNTYAEYPDSIGCVYNVSTVYAGCVPGVNGDHPTGGWGAIALVDAYHDATAESDLAAFSAYFGLPAPKFKLVKANSSYGTLAGLTASCAGTPPSAVPSGWDVEESLDIEWAHTMAPGAHIILVEACSQSENDLMFAEYVAGMEVSSFGGGDVSNSWGYGESSAQVGTSGYDNIFYRYFYDNITYFASAGDTASEVLYPSSSPWVVSAGGTTINRDASKNFVSESCWSDSGGGYSTVETWASPASITEGLGSWTNYQYGLFGGGGYQTPYRSTPDMSFDADPNSGVWVYDSDGSEGWIVVGGTSVSSPALAGLVNAAGNKSGQIGPGGYFQTQELNLIYSQLGLAKAYAANFYDVTTGSNGHTVGTGYDQCTGVGSPRGKLGK
jgi:subtilase family serine protease